MSRLHDQRAIFFCIAFSLSVSAAAQEMQLLPLINSDAKFLEMPNKDSASQKDKDDNPRLLAMHVIGDEDLNSYAFMDIELPDDVMDVDGGTIRLIVQNESARTDEIRVIDEVIAVEWTNNDYGARGRLEGRFGWTRQAGGGDFAWNLDDETRSTLFNAWGQTWCVDYRWNQGGLPLGGKKVRIYTHPHITTRVLIYD